VGTFTVQRDVSASAQRTWDVLTDWPRHSGTVPLTRVRAVSSLDARSKGEGSGMVARTGVGPLAYEDRMTVTQWQPPTATTPGRCRLRKLGRMITGDAAFTVTPVGPERCRVVWEETVKLLGFHSLPLAPAVESAVARLVFTRALRLLARTAEAA
jgi:hypothetical protein